MTTRPLAPDTMKAVGYKQPGDIARALIETGKARGKIVLEGWG